MSIEFGTRGIAELSLTGLRGVRGVGFSRLQFILEVNLAAVPKPPVRLAHLVADVAAGGGGGAQRPLGKASPQNSWFVATLEHAHKVLVWLEIDLSGEQVEALERLRAGGPLVFQMHVSLQLRREAEIVPGSEVVRLEVDINQWATVLKELGYLDLLIVAVELPIGAPDSCRSMAFADLKSCCGYRSTICCEPMAPLDRPGVNIAASRASSPRTTRRASAIFASISVMPPMSNGFMAAYASCRTIATSM